MVLVFVGTFAQVKLGLYAAQENYFQSLFVWWGPTGAGWRIPVFPGGYLLGAVLLVNLISAHIKRFELSRKKVGIFIIHFGLILLLLGQFATETFQVESAMRLVEGNASNYSESFQDNELVVIDMSAPAEDTVVTIPESMIEEKKEIPVPQTPFTLRVHHYWENSELLENPMQAAVPAAVTNGVGQGLHVLGKPPATKMDERSLPTAIVEVQTPDGSLGNWLVSSWIGRQQTFEYQGQSYQVAMRFTRHYKPYRIHLIDFRHDKYKGTEIPKNFSSRIRVVNPKSGEDREVLIRMNEPLRYKGETYYQGSFDPKDERVSILQVVRNPSWLTPYVSCALVALGLIVQFLSHLIGFVKRRTK